MSIQFTAHNIRLDNGSFTKPDENVSMKDYPVFISAKRILDTVFPGDKSKYRLADLGCLEGGYSVEFARMGFQVVGLDVRESNIAACNYVKANTDLMRLQFIKDDVWNISAYGKFDAIFCCGLLYHLDRPNEFLHMVSKVTSKVLILQTHFSVDEVYPIDHVPKIFKRIARKIFKIKDTSVSTYNLSPITENESLKGRWFSEFISDAQYKDRENLKWASWDNRFSFWVQKEYLLQAINDAGFGCVMEQYDSLSPNIADGMLKGYYKMETRGTFIGIKVNET